MGVHSWTGTLQDVKDSSWGEGAQRWLPSAPEAPLSTGGSRVLNKSLAGGRPGRYFSPDSLERAPGSHGLTRNQGPRGAASPTEKILAHPLFPAVLILGKSKILN